jgi:hypothetical protein
MRARANCANSMRRLMPVNDNRPAASPNDRALLTVLACVVSAVVLVVMYYKIVGF